MIRRAFRRFTGLKRLFIGAVFVLSILYVFQSFLLNSRGGVGDKTSRSNYHYHDKNETFSIDTKLDNVDNTAVVGPSMCGVEKICPSGQLTFSIISSVDDKRKPQICLNNLFIFDHLKVARGLNVVILDGKKLRTLFSLANAYFEPFLETKSAVQDIKYFDLLSSDREFVGFMVHVPESRVIFIASYGDVVEKFSSDTKEILEKYGSRLVKDITKSSSFVMVGQRGLKTGLALEKLSSVNNQNLEGQVEMSGCLQIPMGKLEKVIMGNQPVLPPDIKMPQVVRRESIIFGEELGHCGLRDACRPNQVSAYLYSGKNKDDEPKICVNGRFVMARNLNKAGRGLNLVIINATSKEVLRVGHFDTYGEDSATLEIFLEEIVNDEMILAVSFDEASSKLSPMAKQMFYELGSGLIQNLKFRASWFFVGQKGISGFTPFEELNYAVGNDWAKVVDKRICIPIKLDGMKVRPDPTVVQRNEAKRHFCEKYDGYEDFCDEQHIDDPIRPAPLFNKSMGGNAIFKVPILVIAGLAHNSLRLCLETLIRQPGIDPAYVLISYDENYQETRALAQMFQFKSKAVTASASYNVQVSKSLEMLWAEFPTAEYVIIIDEDLMLTVDFLYFMSQTLALLKQDQSLLSISAWNDNGFKDTSTLIDVIYRVEGFPGMGFMMRKLTYDELLKGNMEQCCKNRAWDGWLNATSSGRFMVVPDVPRVLRRHVDGLGVMDQRIEDLFHRDHSYSTEPEAWISAPSSVLLENYDKYLTQTISAAHVLSYSYFDSCIKSRGTIKAELPNVTDLAFAVSFEQKSSSDHTFLRKLCQCFGLYYSPGQQARGLYKNVLRFSYRKKQIFLIGSQSPFAKV